MPDIAVGAPALQAKSPLATIGPGNSRSYRRRGVPMNRRALLKRLGAVPFAPLLATALAERASAGSGLPGMPYPRRVRPNDAAWPDAAAWESLNRQTGGRLIAVTSPFQTCAASPNGAACADALNNIRNPFYIGDQPGLTQTSGWIDAWTSTPSTYAVAAETTADVVAAVNFAREKKPAPRREGRRSQLSRHVGLRRLAVDLDAQDERDRSARRLRPDRDVPECARRNPR